MNITDKQKKTIEQIINCFETGAPQGRYGQVSIMADGPRGARQITYGRSQTTEYGKLPMLILDYVCAGGLYSSKFKPYVDKIGKIPLVNDVDFKTLLKQAGEMDFVMCQVQDRFFDKQYYKPALRWSEERGFKLPLSLLVVYDSFIHSGSVLDFLRKRFKEMPPSSNGDEHAWIKAYVQTRKIWLMKHPDQLLRNTVYRMDCIEREIMRNNWELLMLPIVANGATVR